MIRGLYTAASGMLLGLRQQDVIASNLSNTNTVGYKHDQFAPAEFGGVLARRIGHQAGPVPANSQHLIGRIGTGAFLEARRTQLAQGSERETGERLDIMLRGSGFFAIQTEQGVRYTRDGHLDRDDNDVLVNVNGEPVLDVDGEPIILESDRVRIASDGAIYRLIENEVVNDDGTSGVVVEEEFVARLQVVEIEADDLVRAGDTQFAVAGAGAVTPVELADESTVILQGALEEANVDVGHTATQLYSHARSYNASQRVFTTINETLQSAVRDVGRL